MIFCLRSKPSMILPSGKTCDWPLGYQPARLHIFPQRPPFSVILPSGGMGALQPARHRAYPIFIIGQNRQKYNMNKSKTIFYLVYFLVNRLNTT